MGKYNEWNKQQMLRYYNELIQRFIDSGNKDDAVLRDIAALDKLIKGPAPAFIGPETVQGRRLLSLQPVSRRGFERYL